MVGLLGFCTLFGKSRSVLSVSFIMCTSVVNMVEYILEVTKEKMFSLCL